MIPALVHRLYGLVLEDAELKPFFINADLDKLKRMQIEFLSAALGGPVQYSGRPILRAHHHLNISLANYQRFAQLLFTALASYELSEQECYDVILRLNLYTNNIVSKGADLTE